MKYLKLTNGRTKVDDDMFDFLNQWSWNINHKYVIRSVYIGNYTGITIYMHRLIMNTPKGMDTDHINGDKLDNQRENLRIVNRSKNMMNTKSHKDSKTSNYKGVSYSTRDKIWKAQITYNYKHYYLGGFKTELEAARTYDMKAKEIFGEYAVFNIP